MSTCTHEWDANYVCSRCGAVKHLSAPQWAVVTPMASGPRGVWLALLSFGDRRGPSAPIWPCNAEIQRRSGGITVSTLARHLAHLEDLGWIRRTGDGRARRIELAWISPFMANPRNTGQVGDAEPPQYCDPRNIATPAIPGTNPRNIATPTPAILRDNPRNIATRTSQDQSSTSQDQLEEKRARPCANSADLDPKVTERHAQIVAAQAKLEAEARLEQERQLERERSRRLAAHGLPTEHARAVAAAGPAWERELDNPHGRWCTELARCVGEGLTPEHVTTVLAAWDAASERLGAASVLRLAAAPPRGSSPVSVAALTPPRRALWWACWGPWVAEQLDPGGAERAARPKRDAGRGSTPLSCAAPASTDALTQHDYLADYRAKKAREAAEAAAAGAGAAS